MKLALAIFFFIAGIICFALTGCALSPKPKVQSPSPIATVDLNPAPAVTNSPLVTRHFSLQTVIAPPPPAATITLLPVTAVVSWNDPEDYMVAGYNVYVGREPHTYGIQVSAGHNSSVSVDDLTVGQPYYFAITAINSDGDETDYSEEAIYIPGPGLMQLHYPEPGITGIQSSSNLVDWIDRPDILQTNGDWFVKWEGN